MKTSSELFWEQTERMRQVAKERARGPEFFRPYWETKKGNWELIYPDFDDIKGWSCYLTVKCLDCGAVFMRKAGPWLIDRNQSGCSNCHTYNCVAEKAKTIEAQGFKVLSAEKLKRRCRIYTMRCENCGLIFDEYGTNVNRWIKDGAKCPACLQSGKKSESKTELPPDAVRIRRACIEARITYSKLAQKANYSHNRVACIAAGLAYNEQTAKHIADIAEEMAKEKTHGNSRIGY